MSKAKTSNMMEKTRGNGQGTCRLCYEGIEKGEEQILVHTSHVRFLFHLTCVEAVCADKV